MNIFKRILFVFGILAGILGIAIVGVLAVVAYRAAHYYDFVATGGPIEAMYTPMGPFGVSHQEFNAGGPAAQTQEVWFPSTLLEGNATYPLVVIANGTGVPASKIVPALSHLASWGFVVIGNEDANSRSGQSSDSSLDFMLARNDDPASPFHNRIDVDHIGIAGHSQGGVGAVNAVTAQPHGHRYKAVFIASPTGAFWGQANALGTDWSYDTSKLGIPTFMMAGTGSFDAGTATDIVSTKGQGISPLWSLQHVYTAIPGNVAKVIARRADTDHGETFTSASGYMAAWFAYWLQGNDRAGTAFFGEHAELETNAHWQDFESSR